MKKLLLILVVASIGLTACGFSGSTDSEIAKKQNTLVAESNRQLGLPNIVNFQEKKLLKMIYELRDQENIVNYAYLYNEFTGKLVYLGECIGYGIPYSTQYSNPEVDMYYQTSSSVHNNLPQAEPNGLFMPSSASGTWVMLIDPSTKTPRPVYVEPNVIVSPFKLQ